MFDGGEPSTQKMKNAFVHTLWSWTNVLADYHYQGSDVVVFLSILGVV